MIMSEYVGWLSPSGEFFSLNGYMCHEELAAEILGNKRNFEKYILSREELIDKGWIIIQGSSIYNRKPTYYSKRMLTPYQKLFLKPLIENNEIVEVDIC